MSKKLFPLLAVLAVTAALCAAILDPGQAGIVPFWMCIPFAGLLLSIALFPVVCPHWWERSQTAVVALWSLLFLIPYAGRMGFGGAVETVLDCVVNDYLTFIVLLFGLFCVSGNIALEGNLAGSPRVNVFLLLLGDPDVQLRGHHRGLHNLVFLVMIVAAVILSGTLPTLPVFQNGEGEVLGIPIFGEVVFTFPAIIEIGIILLATLLSFKTTDVSVRKSNHFTWGAIQEVAVVFIGIFITMQPALMLLKTCGASLGITTAFQMFWATGALSSFLDNTPTYLVFFTVAAAEGLSGVTTSLGQISVQMLMAISCGAVFMGASTYIGNAPNFMVKAISDENGILMPSFFGYLLWSLTCLVPVFLLDALIFFR